MDDRHSKLSAVFGCPRLAPLWQLASLLQHRPRRLASSDPTLPDGPDVYCVLCTCASGCNCEVYKQPVKSHVNSCRTSPYLGFPHNLLASREMAQGQQGKSSRP